MRSILQRSLILTLTAAACSGTSDQAGQNDQQLATAPPTSPNSRAHATSNEVLPTTNAIEPSPAVGSLPEPRVSPTSAQGAATVVETYYALIEASKYREALALRWNREATTPEKFAAGFAKYAEYHATVGAPSEIQGAAGSLYVEVPVQLYGRMKDGKPFGSAGTVTVRRVNDVPGSTAEQRRWRIYSN